MVHVVHDQLEAESGDSRATAVCSGSAEAVSRNAVFLAAGGAGLLALPISRGLLPPFASMRSAVLRSSGLVVLAMTAKQRASTALWPGCSDIRDHWEGVRGRSQPSGRSTKEPENVRAATSRRLGESRGSRHARRHPVRECGLDEGGSFKADRTHVLQPLPSHAVAASAPPPAAASAPSPSSSGRVASRSQRQPSQPSSRSGETRAHTVAW